MTDTESIRILNDDIRTMRPFQRYFLTADKKCWVVFFPKLFSRSEADRYQAALRSGVNWKQRSVKLYGKTHPQPRLSQWTAANPTHIYKYSGLAWAPDRHLWHQPFFQDIKAKMDEAMKEVYRLMGIDPADLNSCMLNLYKDGKNYIAPHSDDEACFSPNPTICGITFGATRPFVFKVKKTVTLSHNDREGFSLDLTHGSMVVMGGETQDRYTHTVPKITNEIKAMNMGERINLTFREYRRVPPAWAKLPLEDLYDNEPGGASTATSDPDPLEAAYPGSSTYQGDEEEFASAPKRQGYRSMFSSALVPGTETSKDTVHSSYKCEHSTPVLQSSGNGAVRKIRKRVCVLRYIAHMVHTMVPSGA